ncbi:ATP synthase [Salipiger aestuarii]|uniref:H-type lectin domain-containing protein n=1 Tax=Salipiger aestuarii TaxID=568098 RepID=A0A327YB70_9RHOB|nr:H-type lectin domain-containing protein [Salipiger aestuarii]KAA8608559.1 ATP synthase [Salipiger aestuarii]KAB2542366.1 ATP synthase [Salipiger aestuarii]RAK18310.1 H-type lectin domain-containing protein [Salipiger aestuarii]
MRRMDGRRIGVDQGNTDIFSDFSQGGDMWTGTGARERRRPVTFSEPFRAPPLVQVSLSLWDFAEGANLRADISADDVTETGFDLVFRTWSDTRVARARMSWIAIGEVHSDDDWDLSQPVR